MRILYSLPHPADRLGSEHAGHTVRAAALLGALLAGEGVLRQLIGGGGGLLGATVLAAWVAGSLKRRWPETP